MTRILFLLIATIFAYGADYQPIGSGTHMADPQGGRNLFLFRMLRKGNVHIEPFNSRIILFDSESIKKIMRSKRESII